MSPVRSLNSRRPRSKASKAVPTNSTQWTSRATRSLSPKTENTPPSMIGYSGARRGMRFPNPANPSPLAMLRPISPK